MACLFLFLVSETVVQKQRAHIQNGMLSFDDCVYVDKKVDESLQVKCDDVIMCVRNGSKNLVGKTALIPPNMPMTTWGAFMMIIRSKLNDTYIFHYLNSQMFFSQVFKDTGTATINQITKGILNECRLPLPPETERKQISKMLSSFDAKIQNAEKCLATLVNLKKLFCNNSLYKKLLQQRVAHFSKMI